MLTTNFVNSILGFGLFASQIFHRDVIWQILLSVSKSLPVLGNLEHQLQYRPIRLNKIYRKYLIDFHIMLQN